MTSVRVTNTESRICFPNVPRSSFGPISEVLTCEIDALPEIGREVIRWLEEQKNLYAQLLDWLSFRAGSGQISGQSIGDHNRIAAIEILSRYGHWSAPHLIDRYFSQAVREYHLFAMPLARLPQVIQSNDAKSIEGNILRLYSESRNFQPSPRWRERFMVEVFRTLVEISPANIVGPLAHDLENIADLELTPILESVSVAARKLDRGVLSESPLKSAIANIWDRYIENKSIVDIGNRPGIMGRLLELKGRVDENLDPYLVALNDHPLKMQVLYQFTQRPLDFASVEYRFRWYGETLKSMIEGKQNFALKKFLTEIVVPDMPPELQKVIIGSLTRKQNEHPTV
jgi:hypothetical protein